jgi:hypothetical protein
MRSPIDKSATPTQKLDFIFSHICNSQNSATGRKNDEGGAVIDFSAACMSFDHNFGHLTELLTSEIGAYIALRTKA